MTGTMPGANNNVNGLDGPMTQELHLKMSKKIAQLTKVVYALNTKNDEHDAHVACLQEAHEMELKKVISGTDDRLNKLQGMLSQQRNDKEIIVDLKQRLKEFVTQNENSVRDFKNYKVHVQGKEVDMKRTCEEQVKALRSEMDTLKKDYQQKVAEFSEKSGKNDVSSSVMTAMKDKHAKELELLKEVNEMLVRDGDKALADCKKDFEKQIHDMKVKHREELEEMSNMVSSEKSSLSALYKTQIVQLEEEVSTLKQVMNQSESQSKNKLEQLKKELAEFEKKCGAYGEEKTRLESENSTQKKEITELEEKFMETRRDLDIALQRIQEVESKLEAERNRALTEAEDNMKKTGQIGMLAELQQAHSVENQRLQFEIRKLKDKVADKEGEIKQLKEKQARTVAIWEEKTNDLKKDLVLKDEEMLRTKGEFKIGLEENAAFYEEREKELQVGKLEEIKQIKDACEVQIEEVVESSRANSDAIREALEAEAAEEKLALTTKYEEQIALLTSARDLLTGQCKELQATLDRLRQSMSDSEITAGDIDQERQTLQAKVEEQQKYLEVLQEELEEKIRIMQALRTEFDKEVQAHKKTKSSIDQTVNERVKEAVAAVEEQWQARLKEELNALEQELGRRQSQSRNSEIKKIKSIHLQEYQEAERKFLEQIAALKDKVAALEKEISLQNIESLKKQMDQNENSEAEYLALNQKIIDLKNQHAQHILDIEHEHADKMKRMEESLKKDAKNSEDKIVSSHRQSIHEMTKANKLSVNILKDQLEQKRLMDINTQKNQLKAEMDKNMAKFRKQFEEELELKLHELNMGHSEQKEELQRELEMRDREMKQFHAKVADVNKILTDKSMALSNATDEIEQLRNEIDRLKGQFDKKCKEVMTTKQEAVMQIKKREKKLAMLHQQELAGLSSKHNRQFEESQFKHQNELEALRLQMSELNTLLNGAEQRYANRPSRPEDLAAIEELKGVIAECEEKIKQLMDEKRYYELELVNRESNYNKVFSSAPKIGVMNPMGKGAATLKVKRKSESRLATNTTPHIGNSLSSPIIKTNLRQPKLIPISSSRSSSQESLHRPQLPNGRSTQSKESPGNHLVKNAFLDAASLDQISVTAN